MRYLLSAWLCVWTAPIASAGPQMGTLYEPSYCQDFELRGPGHAYVPQAGDIFLFNDDHSLVWDVGFRLAFTGPPYHSGLVIKMCDGTFGTLEAGPDDTLKIEVCDLEPRMRFHHCNRGRVWVRQRTTPLTDEQSNSLTEFALSEYGKRFSLGRLALQVTPFRSKGPVRTEYFGHPVGPKRSYICSEVVLEALVYAGLLNPETTRPRATWPREIFFDRSINPYLNRTFNLSCGWAPPARWTTECTNCRRAPQSVLGQPVPGAIPTHPLVKCPNKK